MTSQALAAPVTTQPADPSALIVDNGGPGKITTVSNNESAWLDTALFDQCYRVANAMASMSLVPEHLRGNDHKATAANCFLIVIQAQAWNMSPFALMTGTYLPPGGRTVAPFQWGIYDLAEYEEELDDLWAEDILPRLEDITETFTRGETYGSEERGLSL